MYTNDFKGKSWFEICCEIEDQEELEALENEKKYLLELDRERKALFLAGLYEIEDGEIFD
jgi:hypothetical protein